MRKYEVSHICAAVVATVAIVGVAVASTLPKTGWANENHLTNWIIAVATFAGVVVSGFGLYWLRSTLITNQDMVKVSRDALEDQIWLRRQRESPHLTPKSASINFSSNAISLYVRLENDGMSPAVNIEMNIMIEAPNWLGLLPTDDDLNRFLIDNKRSNSGRNLKTLGGRQSGSASFMKEVVWGGDEDVQDLLVVILYSYEFARGKYDEHQVGFSVRYRLSELEKQSEPDEDGNLMYEIFSKEVSLEHTPMIYNTVTA